MTDISAILKDGDNIDMPALRAWLAALEDRIKNGIDAAALAASLDAVFDTLADANAGGGSLDYDEGSIALIHDDPTDANNDLAIKTGVSGAGAWAPLSAFHNIISGLAQPFVNAAEAAAAEVAPITSKPLDRTAAGSTYSTRVGFGTHVDAADIGGDGSVIDAFQNLGVRAEATATQFFFRVWRRPLSAIDLDTAAPGRSGSDVLLAELITSDLAGLGVTPGAAATTIDVELATPFIVQDGYTYGIAFGFLDASDAAALTGTDYINGDFSALVRKRLWYMATATTWGNSSTFSVAVDVRKTSSIVDRDAFFNYVRAKVEANETALDALDMRVTATETVAGKVERSFSQVDTEIFERPFNGARFAPGAFKGWAVAGRPGVDFEAGIPISSIDLFDVELDDSAETLRVKRWTRVYDVATVDALPGSSIDTALPTLDFDVATETSLVPGANASATIPIDQNTAEDVVAIFAFYALDSGGTETFLGFGRSEPTGLAQWQRGYYWNGSGWFGVAANGALAFRINTAVFASATSSGAADGNDTKTAGARALTGYAGRMAMDFDNTTPKTFYLAEAMPCHFDAVRVVLGHSSTVPVTIDGVAVAVLDDLGDLAAATPLPAPVSVTFDGNSSVTLPPRDARNNRVMVKSDLIPLSSLDRADVVGGFPLIAVMAYVATATNKLRMLGKSDGSVDMTSWASHPTYPRVYRYNDGDCIGSPSSFTDTTDRSTGPIIGFELVARGQAISFASFGDSISNGEGGGITYQGENFGAMAQTALNDLDGVCYSHFNAAWSGSATAGFLGRMRSMFEAGCLPDVALLQCWSPNDIASGVITDANIAAMQKRIGEYLDICAQYGVIPVLETGIPNSLADYNATDLLRQAFNDVIREYANRGIQVLDFDLIARDAVPDGDGRYPLKAGFSTDTIHPDDSGHAELAALVQTGITNLGLEWTGNLVTA